MKLMYNNDGIFNEDGEYVGGVELICEGTIDECKAAYYDEWDGADEENLEDTWSMIVDGEDDFYEIIT